MANLSNGKSANNCHPKKKNMLNSNSMGPEESNQVLDLRKSNPDKLCFWCGKRGSLSESGVESDFCSEVCFDQFRRDSFKKRSSCMWCNNSNHGVFNINLMSNLDETKFCSEYCLTQFKVRLFCEETSAHLDKLKDGSVTVMNGVPTSTTAMTTKSSSKSPMSVVSSEGTVASTDLITPDLWLKKSQNKKSPTCTMTSPFHGHSPRRNSASPPMVSPSPSSDMESISLNDPFLNVKGGGGGLGSNSTNRSQAITLPLVSCSGKLASTNLVPANNFAGKAKGPPMVSDPPPIGESLRKRSKLTPQQSPNEFSGWNIASQASKAKPAHLRGFKGSKIRIMENKNAVVKESPLGHSGGVKGVRPPLNVNNCMPFQHSSGRGGGKANQVIPYPQNLFMANGHSNKLNFGSLGLALSRGFGLGTFPSNFIPADDNSTESSSGCSTTSQILEITKRKEPLQERNNQRTNPNQQSKESQTEFDRQSHEAGPETQNLSSSRFILPPVTILVPFPVAVPIPIPIPIPVILGSGFSRAEKSFNAMKASNETLSNSTTTTEGTSTSQVRIECNSTSSKRDVSIENDTDESQINSSSTPVPGESKEGMTQAVCGLVKVEDSLSAAR